MPSRPAAALALALLALAGCVGEGGSATTAPPAGGASGAGAPGGPHAGMGGLMPPVLKVGDWWNFTSPAGAHSYVVSADSGSDYVLDTDSQDFAFYDARFDISMLGTMRKSDLAGSQGSGRVEFLQWPLHDGRSWATTWDGVKLTVTAKVEGDVARLTGAREDGTPYVTYIYSNRTRWFTGIDFKDEQGNSAFELKLQASGEGFPGRLVRWGLKEVLAREGDLPAAESGTFQVSTSATDVYAQSILSCTTGHAMVAVGVAAGPHAAQQGYGPPGSTCPAQEAFAGSLGKPQDGDTWGYVLSSSGVPGAAPAGTFWLRVWERTLQEFEAGQTP